MCPGRVCPWALQSPPIPSFLSFLHLHLSVTVLRTRDVFVSPSGVVLGETGCSFPNQSCNQGSLPVVLGIKLCAKPAPFLHPRFESIATGAWGHLPLTRPSTAWGLRALVFPFPTPSSAGVGKHYTGLKAGNGTLGSCVTSRDQPVLCAGTSCFSTIRTGCGTVGKLGTWVSPKPRGCPPIRTIFHSSPDALVNSRLLGNLGESRNHCWPCDMVALQLRILPLTFRAGGKTLA